MSEPTRPVSCRRIRFSMGKVFPSESDVSRFLARLAVVNNDLIFAQEATGVEYEKGDLTRPGVPVYLLRLAAAHYREAAKMLYEELQYPKVRRFVESLPDSAKAHLARLEGSFSPWDGSFVEKRLKPLRDLSFHYPEGAEVAAALEKSEDLKTQIDFGTGSYLATRYSFADDLQVNLVEEYFGDGTKEVTKTLEEVAELVMEFVYFVHDAMTAYIDRLNEGLFEVETY